MDLVHPQKCHSVMWTMALIGVTEEHLRKAEVSPRRRTESNTGSFSHTVCVEDTVQVMNISERPEVTAKLTSLPQCQS